MRYNVWLDVCGFLVLAIILMMHQLRNSIRIMQNNLYLVNMMTIMCICGCSCVSFAFSEAGLGIPAMIFRVLTVILGLSDGVLWIIYVAAIVNVRIDWDICLPWPLTPLFALSMLTVAGSFSGWFYEMGPHGNIYMGPLYPLILWADALFFIGGGCFAVLKRKYLSRERLLLVPAFFATGIIGVSVQMLYPELQVIHFTVAV
ncbi:MAG: hypothetical protein IJT32_07905, partial [Lachnospiraceae bacterium]|nr:hypothetical protein [Lachnospiraceae bacterium]